MQHENYCTRGEHPEPLDSTQARTPCRGPVGAEIGSTSAWLVQGDRGTMVDLDHQPGVEIPVQGWFDFCREGMAMAVRGGAIPRPATEPG